MSMINPSSDDMQKLTDAINNAQGGKGGKGGAQASTDLTKYGLPSLAGVPTAQGGFNQELSPDQRAQLLQAMITSSRNGGVPPGSAPPPSGGVKIS